MEQWKPIKGMKGYEASSEGRIRSIPRVVVDKNGQEYFHKGRVLSEHLNRKGYKRVQIKRRVVTVHRLVAQTFIPNEDDTLQVNHKDGDKMNNRVDNLEWVTMEENLRHAYENGLRKIDGLMKYNMSKANKVAKCDKDGNILELFNSQNEAGKSLGHKNGSAVGFAIRNNGICKGFRWICVEPCRDLTSRAD